MFGKNDNKANERIIYQARPNLILGCKKAIIGVILLIILLFVSGPIIQFIGNMQVYMISYIRLPLTRYAAIGIFVAILILIIFIIWQIAGWYCREYILTESKIVVKSGVLLTKKNYMPYSTVQDINTSQSVFARLFNVGSISVFSAYDNNQISLDNIANPSEVEDIIFSRISSRQGYYQPPREDFDNRRRPYNQNQSYNQNYYQEQPRNSDNQFHPTEDYDDVVITPITHEEPQYTRREYEYYPEDLSYENEERPKYEYEPYGDSLEHNIDRAMDGSHESYDDSPNSYRNDSYYNGERNDYYGRDDDYYENDEMEYSYAEDADRVSNSQKNDVDDSSEKVIKRHFDKFKR